MRENPRDDPFEKIPRFLVAARDKRGEIIRQVQTLRGGDRPKGRSGNSRACR